MGLTQAGFLWVPGTVAVVMVAQEFPFPMYQKCQFLPGAIQLVKDVGHRQGFGSKNRYNIGKQTTHSALGRKREE